MRVRIPGHPRGTSARQLCGVLLILLWSGLSGTARLASLSTSSPPGGSFRVPMPMPMPIPRSKKSRRPLAGHPIPTGQEEELPAQVFWEHSSDPGFLHLALGTGPEALRLPRGESDSREGGQPDGTTESLLQSRMRFHLALGGHNAIPGQRCICGVPPRTAQAQA